uniref:PH domain-containing protein n=1 Tax=Cyprinus carpio TaxID=7962 RepID=A0A8C1Z8J2_CYPCA
MSTDDVVCTGWLIKSPPEKKLKRFSWRKRWFVLRRGRMSGNPDVLEYYRSKSSRKPIRTIDLQECEVTIEAEVRPTKRQYQNQHLFVVKTATRIFYLLAKTAEEMNIWVQNIGQICTFGGLNRHAESMDSLNRTPSSQQPSPALSPHVSLVANQDTVTVENHDVLDRPSESEISPPLDYLFLSQCETGTKSIIRCDSISNSERSFEQSSSEYTEDVFSPTPRIDSSPSPFLLGGVSEPPFSTPYGPHSLSSSLSSCLSSPISLRRPPDIFRFDRPFYGTSDPQTPPPLPPKPTHLSDHHGNEDTSCNQPQPALLPRRTSFFFFWFLSLQKEPIFLNTTVTENHSEDSYVPMASPPISCSDVTSDGYIPMSPSTLPISLLTNGKTELPTPSNPDLEPPPVDRNLKPRTRARPPPLDLRGLSTISECPFHGPLTRTMTEPRVDYVKVDEKKTQALQNTKLEWKDVRQSKA